MGSSIFPHGCSLGHLCNGELGSSANHYTSDILDVILLTVSDHPKEHLYSETAQTNFYFKKGVRLSNSCFILLKAPMSSSMVQMKNKK